MAEAGRPSTPPPSASNTQRTAAQLTPEQVRRTEESRLKAKAIRTQREAQETRDRQNGLQSNSAAAATHRTPAGYLAGQKRPYSSVEPSQRDARQGSSALGDGTRPSRPVDDIQPARKFATKYVDYDFSKMTDTKGGFLTADDDPHNRALHSREQQGDDAAAKPAHMTLKEWERHQTLRKLRDARSGPFEPGLGGKTRGTQDGCVECGSLEIDWKWQDVFGIRVCNACKDRLPEKYSLLTKTEAREDYLLTDPELKDEELLPRLERPNPHKATWNNMQLYLRCQVEEYAFSQRKWGSEENLDAEFQKRQKEKKKRKEEKFKSKLDELKKRTRVEAWRRGRATGGQGAGAQFGDKITSRGDTHEHEWGRAVTDAEGVGKKTCIECGLEVVELEF